MRGDAGYSEEKRLENGYDLKLLGQLYPYVKPHRLLLLGAICMVLLITVLDLTIPYVTKVAIDRYIVPRRTVMEDGKEQQSAERFLTITDDQAEAWAVVLEYPELFVIHENVARIAWERLSGISPKDLRILRETHLGGIGWTALVLILIVCLNFIFNFVHMIMMAYLGQRIMHDLRMKLFAHIQGLPLSFFNRQPVGRLVTRVTNDVQNMQEMFTSLFVFLFKDFFLLAGILVILLMLNLKLALATFTVLPLVIWCSIRLATLSRQAFRVMRVKIAEINTRFSETVGGIRIIQLFLQEEKSFRDFMSLNHENYRAALQEIQVLSIFMPLIEALGTVMVAVIIWYGGVKVLSGTITLGVLVAFVSYAKMFFRPVRDLTEKYNILQNALSSAERILLILDTRESQRCVATPEALSLTSGVLHESLPARSAFPSGRIETIAFENVSFAYFKKEPILKNISFKIRAGETTAVVGTTGSGKTTLINLLIRFHDPDAGRILINGSDSRTMTPTSLRRKIALVMQDPFLFSDTIRHNIVGIRNDISDYELMEIVRRAHCQFLIERLPHGLETVLSEGGASLSSGERQLISIARAFAVNPELIIFDEATSYVDACTEVKIHQALSGLMRNRTAIMIAHRLTTARDARQIIVLKDGQIVEYGSHGNLMRKKGFYYGMHMLQYAER
jgi:ATP-binding cassette subfamily B protein